MCECMYVCACVCMCVCVCVCVCVRVYVQLFTVPGKGDYGVATELAHTESHNYPQPFPPNSCYLITNTVDVHSTTCMC